MANLFTKGKKVYTERSLLDKFIIKGILFFLLYLILTPLFRHYIPLWKWMMHSIVFASSYILELFGYRIESSYNLIIINGEESIRVVKECLGKRPFIIFIGFLLIYPGKWKFKAWYIPLGIIILHLYNIIRISILGIITYNSPAKYDFYHDFVFKILFYMIIFLLWLIAIKGMKSSSRNFYKNSSLHKNT